ncbi:MAG: Pectinesterase A [Candidatus Celerinatantimonas neptuna]|nr:MAG: Pectinesterase A [Candidatus Celerinatantimonas neptuna]
MKINWLIPIIGLCLAGSAYALDYNAVVTKHPSGNHQYKTLTAAIAAAPGSSSSHFYIYVKNGIYKEKINLKTKNVSIIGQSQQDTVIGYEAAAGQTNSNGEKWGTSGSYVLSVNASNVELKNLTIKNTFDYLTNDAKSSSDSTKISSSQAVALLIGTDAKKLKM